jgi:WD40 repeat protein/serine/threonine protein kinase
MLNQTISHYRILEPLGASGMGEIYKAEDLELKRTVALKFLAPELFADNQTKQHLLDEARAAAALNHPNIAIIYELGQFDGLSFIVMECIDGVTLSHKIEQGPIEIITAIDVAIEVAEALRATHERGLVHCDIKSSNIMITGNGHVKVLDFGLARLAGAAGEGVAMGTLGYMSPEQARGEQLDARTDIFSLGVVLYEMAAGLRPFEGERQAEIIQATLNTEPVAIGTYRDDVPLELESIVRRALEKSRDERYQSAGELLFDLKRLRERLEQGSTYREFPPTDPLQPILDHQSLWQKLFAILFRKDTQPVGSVPKGTAFRGLLPFQEADRDRFYGREMEILSLFDLVSHSEFRFGVLFGESGCGKTSLVRAGLVPRLWEEGYVPIYCRSYKDPLAALLEECRRQSGIEHREQEPPIIYLHRVTKELNGELVIICDQFEEFFINFRAEEERKPFVSFVAECYHTANLPVKFLLSMRSDFLYLISLEFSRLIPEPLTNSRLYHLRNFNEDQAVEIIDRSARRANLNFEAGLSRQVAKDLAENGSVLPSELQIIGEQLQNKRIFTLQEYRRAGGKEPLVHSFLEDVIQASGDQEGAQLLLHSLISEENTKLSLSIDEITKRAQRSRDRIEQILKLFVQVRLIREIQEEEPWRYELMHEYLIEKINQLTGKVINAVQRANRLLRQYLSSYSVDRRTRIPLDKLWTIHRHSDLKRGKREQELLRKSLRWELLKAGAAVLLLSMAAAIIAAFLSVSEEWEEVRLSDGHTAGVRRLVFSPNGRLLVSVGEDAKVIVWDFARRRRLATFTDHTDVVSTVAFSPDEKWIATGSDDSTIIIWDTARLEKVAVLRGHRGRIGGLGFSPDGRFLISRSQDEDRTFVWEAVGWKKVRELPTVSSSYYIFFSSDGRFIINPSGKAWSLATGEQVKDAFEPIAEGIYAAALHQETMRIVGVNPNGVVYFLDMEKRKTLGSYPAYQDNGRAAAFSPDGRLAATGADRIILWDAIAQTKLAQLEHPAIVWSLAFSPDGRWLVSAHGDGAILVWDVAERKRVANFNEHDGSVGTVAFSRDGKRIASASSDRSLIIWNAESRQKEAVLLGHNAPIVAAAFSPDGRSIASTDFEGTIIFWDVARQEPRWALRKSEHPLLSAGRCLAVSPDGRWIATTSLVYDSSDGHPVAQSPGHVYGTAFSPDGRRLVGRSDDGFLLWDTERWLLLQILKLKGMNPLKINYSPDGKWLVTGDQNGTVRLWAADPLREEALLGQHAAWVKAVAFSPDGRQVASASDDKTIALWDVGRRSLITRIGSHTAPVLSVAFSPDGRRLASGEQDTSVRIHTRHRTLWGYRLD